jgi:signal transduction histidine kinase
MPFLSRFAQKRQARVSQEAMEACEQIISEMGADLHDDLVQKLSVLRLHLDKIERSSFDPEETRAAVIKMQADFQGIIDSVRRISRRLHPVRLETDDFHKQIEMLCQNMDMPGAIRIIPSFEGQQRPLQPLQEAYLLRMLQELIHNAFRHSAAWYVWIRVSWEGQLLTIEVEDDGAGFAKEKEFAAILKAKHNTLRMRSQSIGAKILYEQGQKGLLARIELPL